MAKFPSDTKLNFWAENGQNALFTGTHGVGKTALVDATFNKVFGERGKDWLYFSGATMDPWVDFIGVPKDRTAADGTIFLDIIRPEVFARNQVKAIFFDEFNRAHKKVRNGCMELLQFGSINGHRFSNLSCIWAAINPDDDEENDYDVEKLDPSHIDRFQVKYTFGYDVSVPFFTEKYGEKGSIACEWWRALPEKLRKDITPRRLDYCMTMYLLGGSIKDVLPGGAPSKELITQLRSGSFLKLLEDIKDGTVSTDKMKELLSDQNFYGYVESKIKGNDALAALLVPNMSAENMTKFLQSNSINKLNHILDNVTVDGNQEFVQTLQELVSNTDGTIAQTKRKKIDAWLVRNIESYEYTGSNTLLQEFLSLDPENPFEENTYHRNQRIQSFITYVTANGLSEMKSDDALQSEVVKIWDTIISRGQYNTLAKDILDRAQFVLDNDKKKDTSENLREFFEYCATISESKKNVAKIEGIIESLRIGKTVTLIPIP